MGKVFNLLSINDTSSRQMRWLKREETDDSYTVIIDAGHARLRGMMSSLIQQGMTFRECVFTTHGNSGVIYFGNDRLDREVWYSQFYNRGYDRLFPFGLGTNIYFAGCNVAYDTAGWRFLAAAARCLCRGTGGMATGWTSLGFGNPFSGRVKHFWGDTKQVMVLPGGDRLQFFRDGRMIRDATGVPTFPEGLEGYG